MEYRYHLLKYSGKASRLTCPQCGRQRCFTPYVDADDNIIGPEYGRCDHESSCGYVKYPPSDYSPFKENSRAISKKPKPRRFKPILEDNADVCTIPIDTVMKTVRTEPPSDFLSFLRSIFDASTVARVAGEYCLGVTKSRDVIFYQIDTKGRCRTGKVMKYDPVTGHRIKDDGTGAPITWVHSLLKRKDSSCRKDIFAPASWKTGIQKQNWASPISFRRAAFRFLGNTIIVPGSFLDFNENDMRKPCRNYDYICRTNNKHNLL